MKVNTAERLISAKKLAAQRRQIDAVAAEIVDDCIANWYDIGSSVGEAGGKTAST